MEGESENRMNVPPNSNSPPPLLRPPPSPLFSALFANTASASGSSPMEEEERLTLEIAHVHDDGGEERLTLEITAGEDDRGGKLAGTLLPRPIFLSEAMAQRTISLSQAMAQVAPTINLFPPSHYRFKQQPSISTQHDSVAVTTEPVQRFSSSQQQQQQQGFIQYGTELTPVFPKTNNSWGPQPVANPYQYHCFPYNGICTPQGGALNLKRKVEESGNIHNSHQIENLSAPIPGHLCHDSVPHTSFLPVQPVFHNPFVFASARGPHPNYPTFPPLNENQGMNILTISRVSPDENSLSGSVSVPTQKRKVCSSNTTQTSDGNNPARVELSSRHGSSNLQECQYGHLLSEATGKTINACLVSKSPEFHGGRISAGSSSKLEDQKEVEGQSLIILVEKELRNTDVGNLGRIVLPKRDAEANLPQLDAKDGIVLEMEDLTNSSKWMFKYRYWPNNRSRMYVMENTGDFVKTHKLQTGDIFIVYNEVNSGKYIVHGKKITRQSIIRDTEGEKEGQVEEAKTRGNGQAGSEQGTLASRDGYLVAEDAAFAPGRSFDLNRETGKSPQFIPPIF